MGRLPRYVVPGQPQHVIQRGNNRSRVFGADADYEYFYRCLAIACDVYRCSVHAYVLMTNHVHLLVTPHSQGSVAAMMQDIGRRYVRYFNTSYDRTGPLWEGRYKASLIDSERYLLTCYRYIELNPVRSGMVVAPEHHRWSSYRANALAEDDPLVSPHPGYSSLGPDTASRCESYRALFAVPLPEASLGAIRRSTKRGQPLGRHRVLQIARAGSDPLF